MTTSDRTEVLYAFHSACGRPSADDIAAWVGTHPDLADDIRAFAEAALSVAKARDAAASASGGLVRRSRAQAVRLLRATDRAHNPKRALDR